MLTRRRLILETEVNEVVRGGSFVRWGALLALWGLLFWPILHELWDVWMSDSDNSHGVLVPVIAAFLIWQRRKDVLWAEARPSLWGLGLLAGSLLIYLVSLRAHIVLSARIAMVGSLAGLVWWHLGGRVFRQLLFPLAFLGFMVPVPDSISGRIAFPLQLFATSVSAQVIRAIGIPVVEEGTMLYFATTSLEVSEACSGIRSMLAYLMLGALFTHLAGNTMNRAGKGILLLSTIPLALFVNIMRISATGVLASLFGGRMARGFLHEFSGLVIFAVGFALFWLESLVLRRWMPGGLRGLPLTAVTEEK
jgi:exosortase